MTPCCTAVEALKVPKLQAHSQRTKGNKVQNVSNDKEANTALPFSVLPANNNLLAWLVLELSQLKETDAVTTYLMGRLVLSGKSADRLL